MKEIKCPNCKAPFKIDESGYSEIVNQVRDQEFEKRIEEYKQQLEKSREQDINIAVSEAEKNALKKEDDLKIQLNKLKSELESHEVAQQLAVKNAVTEAQKERDELRLEINKLKSEHELALVKSEQESEKKRDELRLEINKLESAHKLALVKSEQDSRNKLYEMKTKHDADLKQLESEIERLKDYKLSLSTKMMGESLEEHCFIEFNKMRQLAFPKAKFYKDNDASQGTKGDFIFSDFDDDGTEFISIMFEMKNENEATKTKKKNSDFFKKLDEDRKAKKCEFAVLVSMLETDNELYNQGIVDVSHEYEKMFVVRPQFFIPFIGLLREAARSTANYKREIAEIKRQNIDITNFEQDLEDFKSKFGRNVEHASNNFKKAIKDIDKAIEVMKNVKKDLELSGKHLELANGKAEKLTIKSLTKNSSVMRQKFSELESAKNKEEILEEDDRDIKDSGD